MEDSFAVGTGIIKDYFVNKNVLITFIGVS